MEQRNVPATITIFPSFSNIRRGLQWNREMSRIQECSIPATRRLITDGDVFIFIVSLQGLLTRAYPETIRPIVPLTNIAPFSSNWNGLQPRSVTLPCARFSKVMTRKVFSV
ncbi:hypothetical protein TNCV_3779821 [Trichonephila clavipes]|nr:hypothetical protein TNCV_3779821 [Trichonephila clavipes]